MSLPGSVAATPSLMRALNERTVLKLIRSSGPLSRAQIARETGLSKPTVSQALAALSRSGLVREAGKTSGGKGPTAVLYELNARAGWVVGIVVEPDRVRAAVADLVGSIVAEHDQPSRTTSASALIAQVGEVAHGLAAAAGLKWGQITYATVGSPGVFVREQDRVAHAHNLPGWGRHGLVEAVTHELGTKVGFENDVNLAAVGEQWHGLGRGVRNFAYLHVGTGVGMGLILAGELFRGATGAAGEIGYLPLGTPDPRDAANRRRGALEVSTGKAALVGSAREMGMGPPVSLSRIFAAARRGERAAQEALAQEARRIGLAIAAIVPVIDPELVILGGSIGGNSGPLVAEIEREIHALIPFRPRVAVSELGEDAALHGAIATGLLAAQEQLFARGFPAAVG